MRLDIAALSDIGRRKKNNEDSYVVIREGAKDLRLFKEGALVCVADGLGGHTGGEIASKLAVKIVGELAKDPPPRNGESTDERNEGPLPKVRAAIDRANESIFQTNKDLVRTRRPMGTTVLAAIIYPKKIYIGNVGDSRCYHIRDGEILAQTEDHSWVDEQVKMGLMSKTEAESDRRKNIVTRCVGTHEEVTVDTYRWHIVPGDMLLMCTDGLVNMVTDDDIKREFQRNASAAEIAHRLVNKANENGGKDNITVVIVSVSPAPFRLIYMRITGFLRRNGVGIAWALFLLVYGALAFLAGFLMRPHLETAPAAEPAAIGEENGVGEYPETTL
ncbi:MAG: Stp1/IreP family PP2C-type Ser/Thr phosphatase [Gammaproteobacteria bacterium]|nr:Stp1/IreP family PP2C-type Ser/Thr phosphatase [Gammaproteobacteria bacterium]